MCKKALIGCVNNAKSINKNFKNFGYTYIKNGCYKL